MDEITVKLNEFENENHFTIWANTMRIVQFPHYLWNMLQMRGEITFEKLGFGYIVKKEL